MTLDLEYTIDTRSPEERHPCRCAECEAAGECERRNVALLAELRKESVELREAVALWLDRFKVGSGVMRGVHNEKYEAGIHPADALLAWYRKERAR